MSLSPASSSCKTSVPATGGAYGVPRHMPTVNPITAFFYSFFGSTPGGPNATKPRPLTLAEEARRLTQEAQREIKLEQEARMRQRATYLLNELKRTLNSAARDGRSEARLGQDLWDRSESWMRTEKDLKYFCGKYLPKLAGEKARGLKFSYVVKDYTGSHDPRHTVERAAIIVSW